MDEVLTGSPEQVCYVAYGSNTDPDRFARYDSEARGGQYWAARSRHVPLTCFRYFAGRSARWDGSVAFVSLWGGDLVPTPCRAYLLTPGELVDLARQENGYEEIDWTLDRAPREVGGTAALPVALSPDGTKGKYNVLVRVPDVDGRRAFTLTTARLLDTGQPSGDYVATIERGLGTPLPQPSTAAEDNRDWLPSSAAPAWGATAVG